MEQPDLLLRRLITHGGASLEHTSWDDVVRAMHRVIETRTPESEDLLRAVLVYRGSVPFGAQLLPHSQPPLELMHMMALQTLAKWDRVKHRDIFSYVAANAKPSSILSRVARSYL